MRSLVRRRKTIWTAQCEYIAADNPEAALRVRQVILATADFLAENPEIGRRIRNAGTRHRQIRWFVVPKFRNYLIFYQPSRETILVVRILHAAQDWTRLFGSQQESTSE